MSQEEVGGKKVYSPGNDGRLSRSWQLRAVFQPRESRTEIVIEGKKDIRRVRRQTSKIRGLWATLEGKDVWLGRWFFQTNQIPRYRGFAPAKAEGTPGLVILQEIILF